MTTGNKRLDLMMKQVIESQLGGGKYLLDCYMGKTVRTEYSHTITTRTATDSNTFVLEIYDEPSDRNREPREDGELA